MAEISISCEKLTFTVPNNKNILEDVSCSINKGAFTVVVGENGAGKTTLLKLLMGFLKPTQGKILVNGLEPYKDPYWEREKIAYIAERLSPPMDWSVGEYLEFNKRFYKYYSIEKEEHFLNVLKIKKKSRIGQLSTGETRRVQVVASLATNPNFLFIDEITAVMDIVGRAKFLSALQELRSEHLTTVVMATNIIDDVDSYATDFLLINQGKLVTHSTKDEITNNSEHKTLTQSIAHLIEKAETYI